MTLRSLSTAADRRSTIVSAALTAFSRSGYTGTTIADVAREAAISSAYVLKLFGGKEALFVAALDECFERIEQTLASAPASGTPGEILDAMGDAYAELIADRTLLLIQVHAQSVAMLPAIGDSLRAGLARTTRFAKQRSGAPDDDVQRFIAYGQLCHLVVTSGIADLDDDWTRILTDNLRHPEI
ncbi:TetR/AcrR family transcriptional regulator [Sanguibacter suaedae]|uniref:TetR family transcriptional regulator n=1 Tax=Sanguibacter suaedae TaxID=2795737 RepID=A0A934MDJ2_9MICO|nr:TetR family transcriptional regulator [Sanguibacter suaedae]MBI9114854.1 TetR family transcriptional regulator [Sanguibacter suaedae]